MPISKNSYRSKIYKIAKSINPNQQWKVSTSAMEEVIFNYRKQQIAAKRIVKFMNNRNQIKVRENKAAQTITTFMKKMSDRTITDFIKNIHNEKTITVNAKQFKKFLPFIVIPTGYYLIISVKYINDGITQTTYKTISNIDTIKEMIKNIENGYELYEHHTYSSDAELIYDIMFLHELITLQWRSTSIDRKQHSGAYFKYYNCSKFDLSRYQIFDKSYDSSNEDKIACFMYALKQSELVNDEDMNNLMFDMATKEMKTRDMQAIAKRLNITIKIRINATHVDIKNAGQDKILEIGLIDGHYFLNEKTNITTYAIENYDKVVNHKKFPSVRNPKSKKKLSCLSSYQVISKMFENKDKFFQSITLENLNNKSTFEKLIDYKNLREPQQHCKCIGLCQKNCPENEFKHYGSVCESKPFRGFFKDSKKDPNLNHDVWFVDTETFLRGNKKTDHHISYCLCAIKYIEDTDYYVEFIFYGLDCVEQFMKRCLDNHSIVYAHNMAFDFRQFIDAQISEENETSRRNIDYKTNEPVLMKFDNGKIKLYDFQQPIETGTKLKQIQCKILRSIATKIDKDGKEETFKVYKHIVFKDSYAFIANPLRDFPGMFALETGDKEIYPYKLITSENFDKCIPILECYQYLKPNLRRGFLENSIKIGAYNANNKTVDIKQYTIHYCMQDTKILAKGFIKFRNQIKEVCKIDIKNLISLPQLADKFQKSQQVYDGCYSFNGIAQDFIRRCSVGGRVMIARNEKLKIKVCKDCTIINGKKLLRDSINSGALQDFDARSLYPSSMYEMKGYLKGLPHILSEKQIMNFNEYKNQFDAYFVEIKVISHTIDRDFPLQSIKNHQGVRRFTNNIDGEHLYVDNMALEDLVEFQGVEYEIIRGYYFNDGFNTQIHDTIKFMYDERLRLKKEGNQLQLVFKLLMNSSYGKLLQKPINSEKKFVSADNLHKFITRHYKYVSEFSQVNEDLFVVKLKKAMITSFACPHIGAQILSMSKRLMNQVMCLAEDNGIKIRYQDTDSMHVSEAALALLASKFEEKYHKELIGKAMGQFHSDFEVKEKNATNVRAIESVFLGKKCYVDKLAYEINGRTKYDYHVRMKGVPCKSVIDYQKDIMKTYKTLFSDEENGIEFDLSEYIPLQLDRDYRARANTRCSSRILKFKNIDDSEFLTKRNADDI